MADIVGGSSRDWLASVEWRPRWFGLASDLPNVGRIAVQMEERLARLGLVFPIARFGLVLTAAESPQ
ncbi:MAG: hypothetical protein JWO62_536 [Acidimicrobiaceae bacterium]|nr:hypothetical protein [Acidimicrobiaceae bacterium]